MLVLIVCGGDDDDRGQKSSIIAGRQTAVPNVYDFMKNDGCPAKMSGGTHAPLR